MIIGWAGLLLPRAKSQEPSFPILFSKIAVIIFPSFKPILNVRGDGGTGLATLQVARSSRRRKAAPGRWEMPAADASAAALAERLASALDLNPSCARILVRRGIASLDDASHFLLRRMDTLHDPARLPDIQAAVARIAEAVEKKQHIVLFGDYDVDGITSTALLTRFFRVLSQKLHTEIRVTPCVPERRDGYGLSANAAQRIAALEPGLLITLDNGISSSAVIADFKSRGIDCIVVDHHHIGEGLPAAVASINPRRRDGGCDYPFTELCGAGVTFKLAWALAVHFSHNVRVTPEFRTFLLDAQALVAFGTLADVVPLTGENRILAYHGLVALERTRMPGLKALLKVSSIAGRPAPRDVSFRIAPRINAAGRCGHADEGLAILLTDDEAQAQELAARLDGYNSTRQGIEEQILGDARRQAQEQLQALPDCRAFVLHSPGWDVGVIGIVASRIVEEFHRPAILLAVNPETNSAHGSGRSIRKLHLYEALHAQREHVTTFGGHAAAAGLTLPVANIGAFQSGFQATAGEMLSPEDLIPVLHIDEQTEMAGVTARLCADLEKFEPCGAGNPRPLLAAFGAAIPAPPKLFGAEEQHLSFFIRQGNATRRVVGFGAAGHFNQLCELSKGGAIDIAFRPQLNTFRGQTTVELQLEAFRPSR